MGKHFFVLLFCFFSTICQAQHLPKLSNLGLVEIESVSVMVSTSHSDTPDYFKFNYENGYVTSGSLESSYDDSFVNMSLSSNPLVLTTKTESEGGLSYENATLRDFIFNNDETVKQYTIFYDSYSSRYGKETYEFPVKLYYDTEKHLTKVESKFCDIENEWVEGNLHRQITYRKYEEGTYSKVSTFTYGQDINPGVEVLYMEQSITLEFPLVEMGVFGRPSKNLPITMKYKYSDEDRTHSVYYNYDYDEQNRIIAIRNSEYDYKFFKYSESSAIENIRTQSSASDRQIYGLYGTLEAISKGIKIIRNADGINKIVFIK